MLGGCKNLRIHLRKKPQKRVSRDSLSPACHIQKHRMKKQNTALLFTLLAAGSALATVLLLPPARNRFFATKLWPFSLPWDTNKEELEYLRELSQPGDLILESNLHGFQWVALCLFTMQTSWVHAAIVDENRRILTVEKEVIETDFEIYQRWGSTRLCLLRPPYQSGEQIRAALDYARSNLGKPYDASFNDDAGNCNGLVGSSLVKAGIEVPKKARFGKSLYAPDSFFKIKNASIIWLSDEHRQLN